MDNKGFTIIELIVVLGLVGILLAIAAIEFSDWQKKALVERQAKEMYTDLQEARMRAAFTKQRQTVDFGAKSLMFRRYSTLNDVGGTEISTKNLPYSISRSAWITPSDGRLEFDTKGVCTDANIKVICINNTVDAAYDALVITPTLTNLGKVTPLGASCAQNNVIQK